jgi:hypothetical protein
MSSRTPVWLALWSLTLFTAALLLNTRANTFPYFYHPDESEKAAQLLTGDWNFHHPMLLLTTSKAVLHVPQHEQNVVEIGRWASAVFASLAVVALSLLGYVWRGWIPCIAAGFALLLHHQFFELAHYAKEDTALLFGVSFTLLAAYCYWQRPSIGWALALGIATACAISGKYLGATMLLVTIPVLWRTPLSPRPRPSSSSSSSIPSPETPHPAGRGTHAVATAIALFATLALANLPALLQLGEVSQSFDRELNLAVHGQSGTTRSVPHALYWNVFRDNTTPVIWILLAAFLYGRWRERRSLTLVEWLIIGFPFAYALALSFSPKANDRYFLPATGVLTLFAACGIRDAARLISLWRREQWVESTTTGVLATALIFAQYTAPFGLWSTWSSYDRAFARDDNRELFEWVKNNLPPDAIIAKDSRVQLPSSENSRARDHFGSLPQEIRGKKYAADLGTIRELRKSGVTHVAVSESDYGRFFLRGLRPKKDAVTDFERRRVFYKKLLREGKLLFATERGTVLYLHPGLRLYTIPPAEE